MQEQNCERKKKAAQDKMLLKKSSLYIPLLPEREDDKKIASLLSMKLTSSKSVAENTDLLRKNMLSESSLPTNSFSRMREIKAIKILGKEKQSLGIIPKRAQRDSAGQETKKVKMTNSLVEDYGSTSGSD